MVVFFCYGLCVCSVFDIEKGESRNTFRNRHPSNYKIVTMDYINAHDHALLMTGTSTCVYLFVSVGVFLWVWMWVWNCGCGCVRVCLWVCGCVCASLWINCCSNTCLLFPAFSHCRNVSCVCDIAAAAVVAGDGCIRLWRNYRTPGSESLVTAWRALSELIPMQSGESCV